MRMPDYLFNAFFNSSYFKLEPDGTIIKHDHGLFKVVCLSKVDFKNPENTFINEYEGLDDDIVNAMNKFKGGDVGV